MKGTRSSSDDETQFWRVYRSIFEKVGWWYPIYWGTKSQHSCVRNERYISYSRLFMILLAINGWVECFGRTISCPLLANSFSPHPNLKKLELSRTNTLNHHLVKFLAGSQTHRHWKRQRHRHRNRHTDTLTQIQYWQCVEFNYKWIPKERLHLPTSFHHPIFKFSIWEVLSLSLDFNDCVWVSMCCERLWAHIALESSIGRDGIQAIAKNLPSSLHTLDLSGMIIFHTKCQ